MNDSPTTTSTTPPTHARNRRGSRQISSTQIMFAIIVAVGLMLSINFSMRITADRDLQQIRSAILQEIELLQREQVALQEELTYVESDAYVEAWARSGGKMIRPGEVLVLPIPSSQTIVEQTTTPTEVITFTDVQTTAPQPETWQLWWTLFFDSPPPEF